MMARNDVGGTSTLNLVHWIQLVRSGNFQWFDYGKDENLKVYGKKTPPQYDMSHFSTKMADIDFLLIVGAKDALVNPKDFEKLKLVLPPNYFVKNIDDYNHLDYMWAKDVNEYVNNDIRTFLSRNNTTSSGLQVY